MNKQCECKVVNDKLQCEFELKRTEVLNKIANRQFKALLNNEMKRYYHLRLKYEKVRSL